MHKSVMLKDSIKHLDLKSDNFYIDTTFGLGGHSLEIKKYINKKGKILACDKSLDKYNLSKHINIKFENIKLINIPFEEFIIISKIYNTNVYDGIICDLGISHMQLSDKEIGFSYKNLNFLDMRLNSRQKIRAIDWINNANKKDLIEILNLFNNINYAIRISNKIIKLREKKIIKTSDDIKSKIFKKKDIIKLFNLIRIFINNDISSLKMFLLHIIYFLKKNSTIIILTFNSLEDKIVKTYLIKKKYIFTEKKPSINELEFNISSKSATMRIMQNITL